MATRTSRRGGGTPTKSHTPTISSPRQRSPLSPTRQARLDEKRQMQNLNDRLASYIEAVCARDLEIANLKQERTSIEETHTSEVTQVKMMYDREMTQLRKAVDAISREKAKLEIEAEKGSREAREAKSELASKEKRLDIAERELQAKTRRLSELENRLNDLEEELKHLRPENAKLKKKLEDAKRNLEDETLKRTDYQNQLLSMQESLKFENSMLEQQLNETRTRKQMELSEIDGRLSEEYERKLQEALNELRDTYETQLAANKHEFSQVYDEKISKLQARLDNEKSNSAGTVQEIREMQTKIAGFTSRNLELEASNSSLQKRMADLLKDMAEKEATFRGEMARKDAEVKSKEEQMEDMLKEYKELMEIKVALDMEIAVYRKLLEGEEARIGLSPSSDTSSSGTPAASRGLKRKRTFVEEEDTFQMVSDHSGLGTVNIEPLEKGGKCIKVTNKSDEDVSIGGWTLINESGEDESSYKFHRTTVLEPGATCSIWSADSNEEHSPPTSLVMKKGGWVIGSTNRTVLRNKDGNEEACRLSREEQRQRGSYRTGSGRLMSGSEPGEKCRIM